jgi:hypothetical protein
MIPLPTAHERIAMSNDAGLRTSRYAQQKQRARRVRIGVMLVLCALPVAFALARTGIASL